MDLYDRAKRYLDVLLQKGVIEYPRREPSDPQDSHSQVFFAACVLVQGFGFSTAQARPLLEEFCSHSDQPWTPHEIDHKLSSAERSSWKRGRGCLAKGEFTPRNTETKSAYPMGWLDQQRKLVYDAEKLKRFAARLGTKVDQVWLANRSAQDPATVDASKFLELLYEPGEKVGVLSDYYATTIGAGITLWPDSVPPMRAPEPRPCGVWFINQPIDGKYHPADSGEKMSCRNLRAVTAWRYLVIESDEAPTPHWLNAIAQLPLRIAALYSSGGRSVHALVRVDCENQHACDGEAKTMKKMLTELGADPCALTPLRLTRLPGCWRHGKMVEIPDSKRQRFERFGSPKLQKLLYINPRPPLAPLAELFARRDVVRHWCDLAAAGTADTDETGGEWIERGLEYYASRSADCEAALREMKGEA